MSKNKNIENSNVSDLIDASSLVDFYKKLSEKIKNNFIKDFSTAVNSNSNNNNVNDMQDILEDAYYKLNCVNSWWFSICQNSEIKDDLKLIESETKKSIDEIANEILEKYRKS